MFVIQTKYETKNYLLPNHIFFNEHYFANLGTELLEDRIPDIGPSDLESHLVSEFMGAIPPFQETATLHFVSSETITDAYNFCKAFCHTISFQRS